MKKFNLVGNTFTHLTNGNKGYSVHGKVSKYIEWVHPWTPGFPTFFIDDYIEQGYDHSDSPQKYAWLLESKWINPAIQNVKQTDRKFLNRYDAIFTHDKELVSRGHPFYFVPAQGSWIKMPYYEHNKTHLISMISSGKNWCEGHKVRLEWVNSLRDQVDLFGNGFKYIQDKEEGLVSYMFSVAIENGQYETYFTEKILDCFLTGTIPIYLGAPDIGDYFNMDGIIPLTEDFKVSDLSIELWQSKYEAIVDNFYRALKMEVLEDYIWENYFHE